jgi:hypothetical protein
LEGIGSMDNDEYEAGYREGEEAAQAIIKNYYYLLETQQIQPTHYKQKGFIEAFKNTIGQWNAE